MLKHTFCHLPGIGPVREQRLWSEGLLSWDHVGSTPHRISRDSHLRNLIESSMEALAARDVRFFHDVLPPREHWRLFSTFRANVAYIDIETTGLGSFDDHVTSIALYDGRQVRTYVHGRNLERFEIDIADYDLLVTFNGKSFDLPMLRRMLGLRLDQAHIDLMHVLRSLGQRGGLKAIERRLGLHRRDMEDVDGYFAVLLWREYRRSGDESALETLLAYNVQDVLTLEPLMIHAFNSKLWATPFSRLAMPSSPLRNNPFRAHRDVIDGIRRTIE